MAKEDLKNRIIAHNNEFRVGDYISFFLNSGGEEQEGELIKIIDCVEGLVKTSYGEFRTRLSSAKILKPAPPPPNYDYDPFINGYRDLDN